jgi:hypothetical protein
MYMLKPLCRRKRRLNDDGGSKETRLDTNTHLVDRSCHCFDGRIALSRYHGILARQGEQQSEESVSKMLSKVVGWLVGWLVVVLVVSSSMSIVVAAFTLKKIEKDVSMFVNS